MKRFMKHLFWFCLAAVLLSCGRTPAEPVRVLFLTGQTDLPYHDWHESTPYLKDILEKTARFEVEVLSEVKGVSNSTLASYDALILHYNGPRWGKDTERAIEDFLRSGKGMIAIHGVSYGPFYGQNLERRVMDGEPWPAYAEMMGMYWKLENIGHSKRHEFSVDWVDRDHPISQGLAPTFVADDELYHKMDFLGNVHVLATAYSDPAVGGTGKEEPIVWTVSFGEGRIVHTSLGHDLKAMAQPGFVDVFARGTEWAATGEVTLHSLQSEH